MSVPRIPIVLLGFGNVGRSILRLLDANDGYVREGALLEVHSAFDRGGGVALEGKGPSALVEAKKREGTVAGLEGARSLTVDEALESAGAGAVLVDASITDAASGGPGLEPARAALRRGRAVCFASKGPLVTSYAELVQLARESGARLGASAAVGIPLPTLEVGVLGLRGSKIHKVRGVLNDTANQILRDLESGRSLEWAIEAARRAGTIEEDPRLDLEGWDAAFKLLILARTLWDPALALDPTGVRGVDAFSRERLDAARASGKRVRLIATAERAEGEGPVLRTEPESLDAGDPFYGLAPGEKGVVFETDTLGTISVRSSKGGPLATAACVLKDVLNVAAPRRPFV
jgi:homoserine dehydrogenase